MEEEILVTNLEATVQNFKLPFIDDTLLNVHTRTARHKKRTTHLTGPKGT